MLNKLLFKIILIAALLASCAPLKGIPVTGASSTKVKATGTATHVVAITATRTATATSTPAPTATATDTPSPAVTQATTSTPDLVLPSPDALACPDSGENHDTSKFHTLWNSEMGCHYDHEHGTYPFTPEVRAAFPGFDLFALLGNVGIGHTNPSSPAENALHHGKHGGFKWDVMLANPHGCLGGFEGAQWCVKAAVIQYHAFGDYSIEMQARVHSTVALLKICNPANPNDCGIIYTVGHQDYGQRVSPYQGTTIYTIAQGCTVDNACPVNPDPFYDRARGPYFTIGCIYSGLPGCRTSLQQAQANNADSKWSSKPTPNRTGRPEGCVLFCLLFDVRDTYQLFDSRDLTYPFTFTWLCTRDGGLTYNPIGCRYNNSTTKANEVAGRISAAWDNLLGFDTNPIVGRVTGEGFTDKFGTVIYGSTCTEAGDGCYPIKLDNVPVVFYGDYLTLTKAFFNNKDNTPERDIFFCNGVVCAEGSAGAVPSGWIGQEN